MLNKLSITSFSFQQIGRRYNSNLDLVHTYVYTLIIMAQVIPVTQARKNLLKLVDQVDEEYTRVDLTKNGKVKATLISPDYLDSLEETIYSLEHSLADIKEAGKEIDRGEYITLEEFRKELKDRNAR